MTYSIVKNAQPVPGKPQDALKCAERVTMELLEVGDAFTVAEFTASRRCIWARKALHPAKFTVRKQADGSGWQIRRVE